mmetsp:Transcript_10510/g.13174  ORF Transcript_10510/g.13174 Transcript_10510/m.13174 type:complete len:190 (+) Transcript_10510:215-784(+)
MTNTVLVPIATSTEELEAVTIIDTLRRAGCNVVVASVEDKKEVECSRGVVLVADELLGDAIKGKTYDLIVLPGGMPGAARLSDNKTLVDFLRKQYSCGRLTGAICAAPAVILDKHSLVENTSMTCYPSFGEKIQNNKYISNSRVVVSEDGKTITSQGPGSALEFTIELIRHLVGEEEAVKVGNGMLAKV